MPSNTSSIARRTRLAALVLACVAPLTLAPQVHAQVPSSAAPAPTAVGRSGPPPADAASEPLDGKQNQKIEHITVEDAGARVDEVRYGGRTQSISVKPKANVPSYDVLPNGPDRQGQAETSAGGNGPRVWNVFKF